MLVTDFITSVRYTLQDTNRNRWKDNEILDYINEGMRDIALKTFYNRIVESITVTSAQSVYTLSHIPIKIDAVYTFQNYKITSQEQITFPQPQEEVIEVHYYAYPDTITTQINEEVDIIDALKYFVLHRCYEKEDSPENFNKSSYFQNKYISYINDNMTRWHGEIYVPLDRSYFF